MVYCARAEKEGHRSDKSSLRRYAARRAHRHISRSWFVKHDHVNVGVIVTYIPRNRISEFVTRKHRRFHILEVQVSTAHSQECVRTWGKIQRFLDALHEVWTMIKPEERLDLLGFTASEAFAPIGGAARDG